MHSLRNIALLICDIQSKTIKNLYHKDTIINNINLLLNSKQYLSNMKLSISSELRPDKLGNTSDLLNLKNIGFFHQKNTYSVLDDKMREILEKNKIKEIILTGMETQWCINQSVRDLVKENYIVNVPIDAVGNNRINNEIPLNRIKDHGGKLCLTEDIICENLVNFDDKSSIWYINYLKSKN